MTYKEYLCEFLNQVGTKEKRLRDVLSWKDYNYLYSYSTIAAIKWAENRKLFVNSSKYSATTSRHLNYLKEQARKLGYEIEEHPAKELLKYVTATIPRESPLPDYH